MFKNNGVTIAILILMVLCGVDAYALSVGPPRLEVRLPSGEVASTDYYAQNDTAAPIHVSVEPVNWLQNAYDYKGIAAGDWVKIEPAEFDLKPKEIRKLRVIIHVPKKAKGELVSQIFFTSVPSEASTAGNSVKSRLGVVLYVAIRDTEKVNAEIGGINVSGSKSDKKDEMTIGVLLRNKGNVHIRPAEGYAVISDAKGREIKKLDIVTDYSIAPGQEFTYTVPWVNPALGEGKYKVSAFIKYGKMYTKEKTVKSEKWFEIDEAGAVISK